MKRILFWTQFFPKCVMLSKVDLSSMCIETLKALVLEKAYCVSSIVVILILQIVKILINIRHVLPKTFRSQRTTLVKEAASPHWNFLS